MDSDWAWTGSDRYPGYCLTFIRGMTPAAVAQIVGGGDLRMLTAAQTPTIDDDHEMLVRFGTVPGWVFCHDSEAMLTALPHLRERVPEILQLVCGGDGMNTVTHIVAGRTLERFEPGRTIEYPAEGPPLLKTRINQILADTTMHSALVAAATAIGELVGTSVSEEDLDGPLLTTVVRRTAEPPAAQVISPRLRGMLAGGTPVTLPQRDT